MGKAPLGTIQILRNQKGGWVWPNAYVCLQGGWVGVGKYLRNELLESPKKDFILNLTDLYNLS